MPTDYDEYDEVTGERFDAEYDAWLEAQAMAHARPTPGDGEDTIVDIIGDLDKLCERLVKLEQAAARRPHRNLLVAHYREAGRYLDKAHGFLHESRHWEAK